MSFWTKKKERDPVCGMEIDPKKAAATFEYGVRTYYFCSPSCKVEFSQNPDVYVKEPQRP